MGEESSVSPSKDMKKTEVVLVIREGKSGVRVSLGLCPGLLCHCTWNWDICLLMDFTWNFQCQLG